MVEDKKRSFTEYQAKQADQYRQDGDEVDRRIRFAEGGFTSSEDSSSSSSS